MANFYVEFIHFCMGLKTYQTDMVLLTKYKRSEVNPDEQHSASDGRKEKNSLESASGVKGPASRISSSESTAKLST